MSPDASESWESGISCAYKTKLEQCTLVSNTTSWFCVILTISVYVHSIHSDTYIYSTWVHLISLTCAWIASSYIKPMHKRKWSSCKLCLTEPELPSFNMNVTVKPYLRYALLHTHETTVYSYNQGLHWVSVHKWQSQNLSKVCDHRY